MANLNVTGDITSNGAKCLTLGQLEQGYAFIDNNNICIQQGSASIGKDASVTLNFNTPFPNTNYSVVILDGNNSDKNNYLNGYRLNGAKRTTSVSIWKQGAASNFDWIAVLIKN